MLRRIQQDAQIQTVVVVTSVVSLIAAIPIVGVAVLLGASVSQSPWPFLAAFASWVFSVAAWLVLWGRVKSDALTIFAVVAAIFQGVALFFTNTRWVAAEIAMPWSMIIYGTAFFMMLLHYVLVLLTVIGVIPQAGRESFGLEQEAARPA